MTTADERLRRCSRSAPAPALWYSTLPLGCKISYGLIVAEIKQIANSNYLATVQDELATKSQPRLR
ncbi:MAG: hypothetical protein ACUVVU_06140 [Tepidimonas sp.]|uniref:hypothetical protein n=1 Tax=Tepidimonas sp. TaxID=2002775 RepID=UPI004054A280